MKAFTLIEVLLTLAIISLLLAIVFPKLPSTNSRLVSRQIQNQLREIRLQSIETNSPVLVHSQDIVDDYPEFDIFISNDINFHPNGHCSPATIIISATTNDEPAIVLQTRSFTGDVVEVAH